MKNFRSNAIQHSGRRHMALRWSILCGGALVSALTLPGCSVEVQNIQAAQELKHQAQPAGSVYTGWRVFQDKCASCHGPAAAGTAGGPDLLPRVREMGSRQFVDLVLQRYDWNLGASQPGKNTAAWDALVDDVVQRKAFMLTMPAWQGEPSVSAHIADLYAYLSVRAQGTQGPDRPVQ
jgi:mono/diheme cytochrome c family protein